MKKIIIIAMILAVTVCVYIYGFVKQEWPKAIIIANLTEQSDATLRTEMKGFENPTVGKVKIETTYRGNERILTVMSYSNITSRTYLLKGIPKFIEADNNGDGFFESIMLTGKSMQDFEEFTRKPDGTIEPLSKEKYLELKQKVQASGESLREAIKEKR